MISKKEYFDSLVSDYKNKLEREIDYKYSMYISSFEKLNEYYIRNNWDNIKVIKFLKNENIETDIKVKFHKEVIKFFNESNYYMDNSYLEAIKDIIDWKTVQFRLTKYQKKVFKDYLVERDEVFHEIKLDNMNILDLLPD